MKSLPVKLGVVLVIGLAMFGCAGMRGARWKSFSSTDLYEGFYYVSQSHLLYKSNVQQVSVKLEYTKKGIAEYVKEFGKDYENLSYTLQVWEVDCPARKQRILSNRQYSVEGNVINTKPAKGRLSESLGKSLSEAVCE
jgi:hypothetical protein